MKKRGLSAVIAAVLMILLVIISIGIIWYAIRGMLTNVSEEIQTGTSKVILNIVDGSVKANIDEATGNSVVSLKISRDVGEGELSKIRFVLESDDKKNVELPAENFNQLDEKTFSVSLGEAVFLKSISIAPIIKSESGKESLGYVTDTYKFTDKEQRLFFKNYGLVSWWSMDDNVLDEVGNNNCKFVGNSKYGKGIINNAVDFDGINTYLNCSNTGNFERDEFSIGLWINFPISENHQLGWEGIISKGFITTSAPANTWGIVRNGTKTDSVKFQDVANVAGSFNDNLDSGTISNGWHYISVTRQLDNNVSLYVDGKVVSSSKNPDISYLTNNADLKMGVQSNRYFKGKIDEVMIFDRVLSEEKIKALYSFGSSE